MMSARPKVSKQAVERIEAGEPFQEQPLDDRADRANREGERISAHQ